MAYPALAMLGGLPVRRGTYHRPALGAEDWDIPIAACANHRMVPSCDMLVVELGHMAYALELMETGMIPTRLPVTEKGTQACLLLWWALGYYRRFE